MWFAEIFSNKLIQDLVATIITFVICLSWLRLSEFLALRKLVDSNLSRKLIHIGFLPLYLICWLLFSDAYWGRYFAAVVPLIFSIQFIMVANGWREAPETIVSITRNREPKELLFGPLHYGIASVLLTILFWRTSPIGISALIFLAVGDGLADIIGRRWGKKKLPFNANKSWAGSIAMLIGAWIVGIIYVIFFESCGYYQLSLNWIEVSANIFWLALSATCVEAFSFKDFDNLSVTGISVLTGLLFFSNHLKF